MEVELCCYNGFDLSEPEANKNCMGVEKTRCIARFPCDTTAFMLFISRPWEVMECFHSTRCNGKRDGVNG